MKTVPHSRLWRSGFAAGEGCEFADEAIVGFLHLGWRWVFRILGCKAG